MTRKYILANLLNWQRSETNIDGWFTGEEAVPGIFGCFDKIALEIDRILEDGIFATELEIVWVRELGFVRTHAIIALAECFGHGNYKFYN